MKFKKTASEGWIVFIDDNGIVSPSFTKANKPGMWAMYEKWLEEGNTIEPLYTAEEQAEKDLKDKSEALATQKATCKNLLDETQHKINGDYDFPLDVPTWLRWREIIKTIMRGSELKRIPDKPTF